MHPVPMEQGVFVNPFTMARPNLNEVPVFYHNYIRLVPEKDLLSALRNQTPVLLRFLNRIPPAKRNYRYARGKWTIQELVQHIIDAERVFTYRALCFARQDQTPLPGFDENSYAASSRAQKRNWKDLMLELKSLRQSTELLFASFDRKQLDSKGTANNNPISVRAIGFIVAGHAWHHVNVLRERYLS